MSASRETPPQSPARSSAQPTGEASGGAAPRQMALDLAFRPARGRADFLVSGSNRAAVAAVEELAARRTGQEGPRNAAQDAAQGGAQGAAEAASGSASGAGRLALVGPPRSGKSHLAAVWARATAARTLEAAALVPEAVEALAAGPVAVEDVDRLDALADPAPAEAGLFHLHNLMEERGQPLLLTGRAAPSRWGLGLPDLASRLAAMPLARLEPPDDALLAQVLVKLAHDRRVRVPPQVIDYLVARMERSFEAAEAIIARLDRASLAERRPVTRHLAARVLGQLAADRQETP